MRLWVVGGGAIGGTVAARLARSGVPLSVVDADPGHVARLRDPGIEVGGLDGGAVTVLDAYTPEEAQRVLIGPCDLLLLAVRTQATERALAPFADRLGPEGDVVSLQNGLNEQTIAGMVGADRTVGCVVGFGATYLEPGRVELTSPGDLVCGRIDGAQDPRLPLVGDILANAFPTRLTTNVTGALWGKMLVNATTVLGALGGHLLGELVTDPVGRPVVRRAVAEAVDVATADGVRLPKVFGVVEPGLIATRGPGWEDAMDDALDLVATHFGAVKSVTLRDFELGRPTEIDAVTGEIVRRGERLGVDVATNAAAYRMLREIEAGERSVDPANLEALERESVR